MRMDFDDEMITGSFGRVYDGVTWIQLLLNVRSPIAANSSCTWIWLWWCGNDKADCTNATEFQSIMN